MELLWDRLRIKLFHTNDRNEIEIPEVPQDDELIQTLESIALQEQLQIFHQVDEYMNEFTPKYALNPEHYEKGFAMQSQVFKTVGEDQVNRCKLEIFYQKKGTTEKVKSYFVSLIKFDNEKWRIFQVR